MLIAIDFDDTLTADPDLWGEFVDTAILRGHRVVCVTARRQTAENVDTIDAWLAENDIMIPVYFTSLGSKIEHMKRIGIYPDIWIDDDPRKCALGH